MTNWTKGWLGLPERSVIFSGQWFYKVSLFTKMTNTHVKIENSLQDLSILISNNNIYDDDYDGGNLYDGSLGSDAYLKLSLWKKLQRDNNREDNDELLEEARDRIFEYSERIKSQKHESWSIWTNPIFACRSLLTVIYDKLQQGEASYQQLDLVEEYLETVIRDMTEASAKKDTLDCSILYGLAGTLQGIFFLRRELQRRDWGTIYAVQIAMKIINQGHRQAERWNQNRNEKEPISLVWSCDNKSNVIDWSITTGMAGTLQSLLALEMTEWKSIEKVIPNALESLVETTIQNLPSYGNMDWYKTNGWSIDGASGHVILLSQAYVTLGLVDYLRQAQRLIQYVILPEYLLTQNELSSSSTRPESHVSFFHGVVGAAHVLFFFHERDAACRLADLAMEYCKNEPDALDISLGHGAAGLVHLLYHLDYDDYGEAARHLDLPFLHTSTFNFVLETIQEVKWGTDYNLVKKKRTRKKLRDSEEAGLSKAEMASDSQEYGYNDEHSNVILSNLPLANPRRRPSMSDLDEDSHYSIGSFSVEDLKASYRFSSHGRRPSTGHGSSKSDDSFSLTAGEKEKSNLLSPILHAHDENDSSSFSSSGSHMEMASRDDQACELYLAKQDSDNEEYVQVNHSIRLLSSNPMKKA